MIDLDFLSISSSDNVGLSGADVAGISGFATSKVKKSEKVKMTKIIIKWKDHGLQHLCVVTPFSAKALK